MGISFSREPCEKCKLREAKEAEYVLVKVLGEDNVVHFKIKKHTQFKKLMTMYCELAGTTTLFVRFGFNGNIINETDTPTTLGMEENATIEVLSLKVLLHRLCDSDLMGT